VDKTRLEQLLTQVARGETEVEQAMEALRGFPYDDSLGFATLDTHRAVRTGHTEVVFGQGKTPEQCALIAKRLIENAPAVLITRAENSIYQAICVEVGASQVIFHEAARCVVVGEPRKPDANAPYVALLAAGTSDLPVAEEARVTMETLGSPVRTAYDVGVAGLHRLLAQRPLLDGAACVITVAGMEGALASVVGGLVSCPVVACPTSVGYGASFGGVAALLTMLNSCATGVAVVNIDNGFGAGYFAHKVASATKRETE
jgi:hypothetical protein